MAKAKRNTRARGGAAKAERNAGERGGTRKPWTPDLLRAWRPLRSLVATALYRLSGELAGLSETRPALGRRLLISALTALGVKAPRVEASVTIGRARGEVLRVLFDFEDAQRFLRSIRRVEIAKGQDTARFTFCAGASKGPARTGVMSFSPAPGDRGTQIRAVLAGAQSSGRVARFLAKLLAETPKAQLRGDLRRLQQWMEAGEIATTVGQPSGRKAA